MGRMETAKNSAQVVIDGKVVTLSGYESEEYLRKVAGYVSNKISECMSVPDCRRQSTDMRNILISLNIADDYFKSKKQGAILEEELSSKEKELYDLKHELIASQLKLEKSESAMADMKKELDEAKKQIVKLQTELDTRKETAAEAKEAPQTPVKSTKR